MTNPDQACDGTNATPPMTTPPRWYLGAYVQLSISIVLSAAAQILTKVGADDTVGDAILGFRGLLSGWMWLGILALIGSLLSWLEALKTIRLNIAANLVGVIHIMVPIGSWLLLGELISARRWLGIALVVAGVIVTARVAAQLEEKL
jgi:undecaprenyl phosphate-alpha-L-ara4N flippase subunit ArnE